MAYFNRRGKGLLTIAKHDPTDVIPDIDEKIRSLSPYATPLQSIGEMIGKGKPPRSKKIQQIKHYKHDPLDIITLFAVATQPQGGPRYAALDYGSLNRFHPHGTLYQPQDRLYLYDTDQNVEVVMTEDASIEINGAQLQIDASLAVNGGAVGTMVTRCQPGRLIVRNIQASPVLPVAPATYLMNLGRVIYESQEIGTGGQFDYPLYDANYVEHKEKVFSCTEDQQKILQSRSKMFDFTTLQKEHIQQLKEEVEWTALFGERAVDTSQNGRPKYYMRGFLHAVNTNVSLYNPNTTTSFETTVQTFMTQHAFRYNPNGLNKMLLCGIDFHANFQRSFSNLRRIPLDTAKREYGGLEIAKYTWLGNTLMVMHSEIFRRGTPHVNWAFAIDPLEAEWRVAKNYESRLFQEPREREMKFMVEWQGSIAWHLEEAHALLRTA